MIDKKLKNKLHSIALKNKVSDTVAEIIVLTPFLFQKREVEKGNIEDEIVFYHKYLGKFYIKKSVIKKIREKNAKEH